MSRIKEIIQFPFLTVFEDIIAYKNDFVDMLQIGREYIGSNADLVIQTVRSPSLISEKAFLVEHGKVIRYQKNGITEKVNNTQEIKYGGMVYLWLSNPFPLVDKYLLCENYKLSSFLEHYISTHLAVEMPVKDMWDVDTPEAVSLTREILEKRREWEWQY